MGSIRLTLSCGHVAEGTDPVPWIGEKMYCPACQQDCEVEIIEGQSYVATREVVIRSTEVYSPSPWGEIFEDSIWLLFVALFPALLLGIHKHDWLQAAVLFSVGFVAYGAGKIAGGSHR